MLNYMRTPYIAHYTTLVRAYLIVHMLWAHCVYILASTYT